MDRTYLFFDIECANCFDGVGKMCSFGYVLTDGLFNVLDTDDVVMNPECEFDWYLFSPKNRCPLAYSKDYFRSQRNFESYYRPIKKLMEESERRVIGFSSLNDVGFVVSACERYSLPLINFGAFDIAQILENEKGRKMRLSEWCEFFGIDCSDIQEHKSRDDALMTMRLTQAYCMEKGIDLHELLEKNRGIKLSVEKYIEQREKNRRNRELKEKIQELYGKKCRARLSDRLSGRKFAFGFKIFKDLETACTAANLVYRHGGMLNRHLEDGGTLIMQDGTSDDEMKKVEAKGFTALSVSDLVKLTDMEKRR